MARPKKSLKLDALELEVLSEFAYQPTRLDKELQLEKPLGSRNYKAMKSLLMKRVSPSRYVHSLAVAKTARKIAQAYGYDEHTARMAGLLHDWDKALSPKRLRDRVETYQLSLDQEIVDSMPWLLHGPTAAAVLADQFPWLDTSIIQAIERHTVGAPNMSELDMIVFAADKLEPTNDVEVYKRLAKQIGKISLQDLFFEVYKAGIEYLVRAGRPLNRDSIVVWNWYISAQSKTKE